MPASQILVFTGSDEARVAEAALAAVRKHTPPEAGDFGQDIVDGQAGNSEEAERAVYSAIQALQTLPFFGGGKVVWLKNANFLGDTVTGGAQSTLAATERLLESLQAGLPGDVFFVLSAPALDKRRALFKGLQKIAAVEVFDKVDISRDGWEKKLVPLVQQRARQLGITMTADVAEHFVMMVGEETRRLDSELEKLRTYAGSNAKVTSDDIRAVVSKSRGGIVFEVGNAITSRNLADALSVLEHFLDLGENPVGILRAGIIPKVRQLLLAADLLENHRLNISGYDAFQASFKRLPPEATDHLPRTKAGEVSLYPLFLSCAASSRYSAHELVDALDACLEADRQLVNTGFEAPMVLSQLLVRVLTKSPQAA